MEVPLLSEMPEFRYNTTYKCKNVFNIFSSFDTIPAYVGQTDTGL